MGIEPRLLDNNGNKSPKLGIHPVTVINSILTLVFTNVKNSMNSKRHRSPENELGTNRAVSSVPRQCPVIP